MNGKSARDDQIALCNHVNSLICSQDSSGFPRLTAIVYTANGLRPMDSPYTDDTVKRSSQQVRRARGTPIYWVTDGFTGGPVHRSRFGPVKVCDSKGEPIRVDDGSALRLRVGESSYWLARIVHVSDGWRGNDS